jgi:hypothetical protein
VIFKRRPSAADNPCMTAGTRRRRMIVSALFLATAMGIAAAADGHSAPSPPAVPEDVGDAVSVGPGLVLSE